MTGAALQHHNDFKFVGKSRRGAPMWLAFHLSYTASRLQQQDVVLGVQRWFQRNQMAVQAAQAWSDEAVRANWARLLRTHLSQAAGWISKAVDSGDFECWIELVSRASLSERRLGAPFAPVRSGYADWAAGRVR